MIAIHKHQLSYHNNAQAQSDKTGSTLRQLNHPSSNWRNRRHLDSPVCSPPPSSQPLPWLSRLMSWQYYYFEPGPSCCNCIWPTCFTLEVALSPKSLQCRSAVRTWPPSHIAPARLQNLRRVPTMSCPESTLSEWTVAQLPPLSRPTLSSYMVSHKISSPYQLLPPPPPCFHPNTYIGTRSAASLAWIVRGSCYPTAVAASPAWNVHRSHHAANASTPSIYISTIIATSSAWSVFGTWSVYENCHTPTAAAAVPTRSIHESWFTTSLAWSVRGSCQTAVAAATAAAAPTRGVHGSCHTFCHRRRAAPTVCLCRKLPCRY